MRSNFIDYASAPELPICFQVFLFFFVAVGFFWSSWSFFQVRDTDTATIMGKAGLEVQKPANSIEHAEVQGEEMQK